MKRTITISTEINARYKLTMDHLPQKVSFKRQNVCMATQLLFHTTSKSLINFHLKKKLKISTQLTQLIS